MEIVVLVGIPGSGKSTLALSRFSNHHRINLDTLHTRLNEDLEISNCLKNAQDMVIDNTNTTRKARRKYIQIAKLLGLHVRALHLDCSLDLALTRNASRVGKREFVPERAVKMYHRILQPPSVEEGFDSVEKIKLDSA